MSSIVEPVVSPQELPWPILQQHDRPETMIEQTPQDLADPVPAYPDSDEDFDTEVRQLVDSISNAFKLPILNASLDRLRMQNYNARFDRNHWEPATSCRPSASRVSISSKIPSPPSSPPPSPRPRASGLVFPTPSELHLEAAAITQYQILVLYFDAIRSKKQDIVAFLLDNGVVTANTTSSRPNVPPEDKKTPLIEAVAQDNIRMVQCLVDYGAEIDALGAYKQSARTPLQVAAARGNLALVRLFVEVYHADDALVAPDGEIALRLAARNGHRDVASYLPSRRAGGWLRWKTHHAKAVARIKRAASRIVDITRFLAWTLPKYLVWNFPRDAAEWCWVNRGRFAGWCARQVRELPGRVARVLKAIPRHMRGLWAHLGRLVTVHIPEMARGAARAVAEGLAAVGHAAQRVASFVHTLGVAVVSFLRAVTLRDVWHGFVEALRGVFVTLPEVVCGWIEGLPRAVEIFLDRVFGCFGQVVAFVGRFALFALAYVPRKVWEVFCGVWMSLGKGAREVGVWVNPKMSF